MSKEIRYTSAGFNSAATGRVGKNETVELEDDDLADHYIEEHDFVEVGSDDDPFDGEGEAAPEYDPAVTSDDVSVEGEMTESAQEADAEDDFGTLTGVGEVTAQNLRAAGFESFDDLGSADAAEVAAVEGVSDTLAESLVEQVQDPDDE